MKFLLGLLTLSGVSFFIPNVASSPVAIVATAGPTFELAPLVAVLSWHDKDGNLLHEFRQELDYNVLGSFLSESSESHSNGTMYEPSDEGKAAAGIVATLESLDSRGLSKRDNRRCYTWGSRVYRSSSASYCNQICHIRSAGYYVGSFSTFTARLVGIDVELFNGASGFAGILIAMFVNHIVDELFVSPDACYSYCINSLDACGQYGADNDLYLNSGEYVGEASIDPGSYCENDANRPFDYPTCRAR